MAPDADPYRILGLARGAPLAEVKRAYRRLAKANHPDAAGDSALQRFLAIQTAYDQIAGPDAAPGTTGGRASGPKRPWDAQPDRADATHRAYGGRARRARPTGPRPAEPAAGEPPRPPREPREPQEPRPPKLATMGSTSYDGADSDPFEPDWGGASWYGTTSGTYWTLNPKEYADPRKHGPEYQARARRAAETAAASAALDAEAPDRPAPPTHTTSSWWDATAAEPTSEHAVPTAEQPLDRSGAATGAPGATPAEPTWPPATDMRPNGITKPSASIWDAARWLETGSGGVAGRVIRAVVGWAPVALGIAWLAGEITGCARFSAECDASSAPIAWFAQLLILAVLLIVPRLAAAACIATVGTIVAAVPGSLLLTSMGGAADLSSGRAALGGLLVIGWAVGIVIGIGREIRDPVGEPVDEESGPVS